MTGGGLGGAEGPRIYNLFPLLAGPFSRWGPHLERARAMGFTWLFVNPIHQAGLSGSLYAVKDHDAVDPRFLDGGRDPWEQFADLVSAAGRAGLRVMLDLVLNHTAVDSPLIQAHPAWFKRDSNGELVHPRATDGKREVVWGDLAEVDNAGSTDRERLWAYWRRLAHRLVSLGVAGFRCDAAYQVPVPLWRDLIGAIKSRHPQVQFFAETLGCTPEETLATAQAGFDFIFNSSKWWDFRAPWFLEQQELFAPVVASVSFPESHDTPRLAAELKTAAGVLQRYAIAATLAPGIMMPIGFEYGFQHPLHVVRTTPADWEVPTWDLTRQIAAVNRVKATLRPLNAETPIRPVARIRPPAFAFWKESQDGRERLLVVVNPDATRRVEVPLDSARPAPGPLVVVDLQTGMTAPLGGDGLALEPAGVRVVSAA